MYTILLVFYNTVFYEHIVIVIIIFIWQEIISEGLGIVIQIINIVIAVWLPVVIIHLKGSAFSISEY